MPPDDIPFTPAELDILAGFDHTIASNSSAVARTIARMSRTNYLAKRAARLADYADLDERQQAQSDWVNEPSHFAGHGTNPYSMTR